MVEQFEIARQGVLVALILFALLGILLLIKKRAIQNWMNNITDNSLGNLGFYFILFVYVYGVLSTYRSFLKLLGPNQGDEYSGLGEFVRGFFMDGIYPFLNAAVYCVQAGSILLAAFLLQKYLADKRSDEE